MPEQVAMIEIPVHETTGETGPRVLYDLCRFDLLGTSCHVRSSAEGDILDLSIGRRRFAVSLLDLAATAALAVEAHLRGEIRARIIASRAVPEPAPEIESDGFITLHPKLLGH